MVPDDVDVAVLGTTFTGEADDVAGIDELLRGVRQKRDLDIPIHVDAANDAAGGRPGGGGDEAKTGTGY